MAVVGIVMVFEEKCLIRHGAIHLRVSRIVYEVKGKALMSEIHVLIWVSVLGCEVCDLLVAHASTPKWNVSTVVIHLNDALVEETGVSFIVAVTSW